jgi:hypothetical protein
VPTGRTLPLVSGGELSTRRCKSAKCERCSRQPIAGGKLSHRANSSSPPFSNPDVEWEESGDVLPGLRGVHRGREEVRRWFEEAILQTWESFHSEPEEITEAGDRRVFAQSLATARQGERRRSEPSLLAGVLAHRGQDRTAPGLAN